MIKWNEVTWYSKLAAIIFFLAIVPLLTFYIGIEYQKTVDATAKCCESKQIVFSNESEIKPVEVGEYGYRCEEGTEFTISPSLDFESIEVFPATSVENIKRTNINKVPSVKGVLYKGSGISLRGLGETLELTYATTTTKCSPMLKVDEAPINFGD